MEDSLGTEPFLVYSGDILTDFDLAPLIENISAKQNDVTLALRANRAAARDVDCATARRGHQKQKRARRAITTSPTFPSGTQDFPTHSGRRRRISFIPILVEWIRQGGRIGGVVLNKNKWFNIGTRGGLPRNSSPAREQAWRPAYVKDRAWPIAIAADATVLTERATSRLLFHRLWLRREVRRRYHRKHDPLARCTNCFPKPSPQLYCPLPSERHKALHLTSTSKLKTDLSAASDAHSFSAFGEAESKHRADRERRIGPAVFIGCAVRRSKRSSW